MYLLSTQYVVTVVKKLSKIPILIGTMKVMIRARVMKNLIHIHKTRTFNTFSHTPEIWRKVQVEKGRRINRRNGERGSSYGED